MTSGVNGFLKDVLTRRAVFPAVALAFALACLASISTPASAAVRGMPDDTPDTDGAVYAVVRVGNTVYFGGQFQNVDGAPRSNLAAIDATTGALKPWNPGAKCCVKTLAVSPDGSRIYAGGSFTEVGGVARSRVAAINAASGAVVTSWDPAANATVNALAVQGDNVFIGGTFGSVDGQPRLRLARVSGSTGDLSPTWRPAVRGLVHELRIVGSRLYVGGAYTAIAGGGRRNLTALSADTGRLTGFRPRVPRPVLDLVPVGRRVYTAEGGRRGGAVAAYSAGRGTEAWRHLTAGDAQAVGYMDGRIFAGGHFTRIDGLRRSKVAAVYIRRGRVDRQWAPRINKAVWAITPDAAGGKLYVGGQFTGISGQPQVGLARFSRLP